jgi:hypothetical protein
MKKRNDYEHKEQAAFFRMVRHYRSIWPEFHLVYAVPNQGVALNKRLQDEGAEPGVPDVNCDFPRRGHSGLRIEFKRPGGRLSQAQVEIRERLITEGYCYETALSSDDAWKVLCWYAGRKNPVIV